MKTNHQLLTDAREYLRLRFESDALTDELARSWDDFYRVYDCIIRRFSLSIGVSRDGLEECVQEVWIAVVERLRNFAYDPGKGRFRSWLYRIVRNKAADQMRLRGRHAGPSINDSNQGIVLYDAADSPEDAYDRQWRHELVQVLLHELQQVVSPQSLTAFRMRRIEGLDVSDVARVMNMSDGAVRVCVHRVEKRFEKLMRQYTGLDESPQTGSS